MTIEVNKSVVRRYFNSWIANDTDALGTIMAADVVDYTADPGQQPGIPGYHDMYRRWHAAFPAFESVIHDMIAEGDQVVTRWTFRGRHLGEYAGVAPTGRPVTLDAVSIVRLRDGRICEERFIADIGGMIQELRAG
jgi:steroid delta-isomerase-like uncharacterized protein